MRIGAASAAIIAVLGIGSDVARAGIDLNEVGAFLVYPGVSADAQTGIVETFLTITNTSSSTLVAHVAFINGDASDPRYCYECDFDVPMSGLDTETLVLTRDAVRNVTTIENMDTGARRSCSQHVGFATVNVEDSGHHVLTDNVLLGSEVVIDYTSGSAYSVPAISIQGESGDGDRTFAFDGNEYRKFPSVVGADFLAPDFDGGLDAELVLFTLGFNRQFPPLTDCSVIGIDAFESQFSNSLQFGCFTAIALSEIDPEFAYPYLGGAFDGQEHGWVQLSCTVYGTGSTGVVDGGVHGAIVETAAAGTVLRREDGGPALLGAAAWARILYQSGTVGDALALHLEEPARGGSF